VNKCLGIVTFIQTGSSSSSFNTRKCTGKQPHMLKSDSEFEQSHSEDSILPVPLTRKRPRIVEPDSEFEHPHVNDSIPPLPAPMPSLKILTQTRKQPRILEPDSEVEQPDLNDSIPPLPAPMPGLNQPVHSHSLLPENPLYSQPLASQNDSFSDNFLPPEQLQRGFASSTFEIEGGYYPDFFPSNMDAPSPIPENAEPPCSQPPKDFPMLMISQLKTLPSHSQPRHQFTHSQTQ